MKKKQVGKSIHPPTKKHKVSAKTKTTRPRRNNVVLDIDDLVERFKVQLSPIAMDYFTILSLAKSTPNAQKIFEELTEHYKDKDGSAGRKLP